MRDVIIPTDATTRFNGAVDSVLESGRGTSGFILAHGQAGRGKSVAADQYHYQRGGAYIRVWEGWRQAAFLQRVLFEVQGKNGDPPKLNADRCKHRIVDLLERDRKPVFIDEADRLSIGRIEDLRDILEATGAPIILIGEEGIFGLLSERRRVWSRVAYEVEFGPISPAEVALYAMKAAALDIAPELCQKIAERAEGDFRLVRNMMLLLEKAAKAAENFKVDDAMLETVFSARPWRRK
ncbi:MAG: AAA family ATPase [Desulfovibrio sp.]|nr:AAA family ATPase [Desulfovibrio sp.]